MQLKLKKGLNLNIDGAVGDWTKVQEVIPQYCAVIPDDFHGFVPKVSVKEGDPVKIGSPLLYDKTQPDMMLTSPASGTVKAIVRGERRKILRVVVEVDKTNPREYESFSTKGLSGADDFRKLLANAGLLAQIRQRPYDIVPNLSAQVRDIFVTAFDLAPLAPDPSVEFDQGKAAKMLAAGVAALAKLTSGKVYISTGEGWKFGSIPGAEMVEVSGEYPASNAGVQAANIAPVNKGETIWCLDAVTLYNIGCLMTNGTVNSDTVVAVTGPEAKNPCLIRTLCGAEIAPLVNGHLAGDVRNERIISGNVFTGTAVSAEPETSYLHFPYRQITLIAEGNHADEFMGWASVAPSKMSQSRTFPGHFLNRLFRPDARIHGGRRAMIMSGEYDSVLPMDILAEYLLKAIISRNIESMEKLGIYEIAPEDFAAAEYVDTSKLPLQKIVREGLDYLRKELE